MPGESCSSGGKIDFISSVRRCISKRLLLLAWQEMPGSVLTFDFPLRTDPTVRNLSKLGSCLRVENLGIFAKRGDLKMKSGWGLGNKEDGR